MFSFKKPYFLGIDFGTSSIKAVELTVKDGQPYLVNYGEIRMDPDNNSGSKPLQSQGDKMGIYFRMLLQSLKPKASSASVSMPGFSGLITLIELPKMEREELEKAVQYEARKYIPSSLQDVILSWDVVVRNASPEVAPNKLPAHEKIDVLLVAALKKEVEKYEKYMSASDLKIDLLELEIFSITRALADIQSGVSLIIDIGDRSANLILTEDGVINVNRNLNTGGHEITTTLAESLNISADRANILKVSDKDYINNKESSIVFSTLEIIINESQRIITAFEMKNTHRKVDKIVLSGGVAKMKGLESYFSQALKMPVVFGDPWGRILVDDEVKLFAEQLGASYSVAIGLALAGFDSYERS